MSLRCRRALIAAAVVCGSIVAVPTSAHAELALSQLVVELTPERARSDIEVWNNDSERAYVAAEPREILNPGTSAESRREYPDPERLGLLVSPAQMILEPEQRKLLRIAAIAPPSGTERVYRVTVKPVVGEVSAPSSGLKVLIGYDVLVLVRPDNPKPHVSGVRNGNTITLRNDGNVSVELVDGKRCNPTAKTCSDLDGGRLYVGAKKTMSVARDQRVEYKLKISGKLIPVEF